MTWPVQRATAPGRDLRKPRRQGGPGRRCSVSDCSTVLSTYNPGEYCFVHAPRVRPHRQREFDANNARENTPEGGK